MSTEKSAWQEKMSSLNQRITSLEAENARLRERLTDIAQQPLRKEMTEIDHLDADFETGYELLVESAREALANHSGDANKMVQGGKEGA